MIRHVLAPGIESSNCSGSLLLVATREDDAEAFCAQLVGRLKTQAAIRAGDEGRRSIRGGTHGVMQDHRSLLTFCAAGRSVCDPGIYVPQVRRSFSASPASSRTMSPAFWIRFTPSTDSPAQSGIASNSPVVVSSATNESRACTGTRT